MVSFSQKAFKAKRMPLNLSWLSVKSALRLTSICCWVLSEPASDSARQATWYSVSGVSSRESVSDTEAPVTVKMPRGALWKPRKARALKSLGSRMSPAVIRGASELFLGLPIDQRALRVARGRHGKRCARADSR